MATVGVALYLQQTTFAGNFCFDYRRCVVRGGNSYGVLLAILVPALFLMAVGLKLIWDSYAALARRAATSPAPHAPVPGVHPADCPPDDHPEPETLERVLVGAGAGVSDRASYRAVPGAGSSQ